MYKIVLSSNIDDYFCEGFREYEFDTYEQAREFVETLMNSADEEQKQYCFTAETKGISWYYPSCTESGKLDMDYDIADDVFECYLLLFILNEGAENEGYNTTAWVDSYRREYRINRDGIIFWDSEWIPNNNQ